MAYVTVDVDLGDVYNDSSKGEKRDLVEWLIEDGYINQQNTPKLLTNESFNVACDKLASAYYRMSKEDEEIILNLSKKYGFY
jgi:hypothetical protein